MELRSGSNNQRGDRLINEAIKRILLDIVIRGHGDRLIGRWSREPELQQFLEQVPYMLDRINQLHLACTRAEHLELGQVQHHYHKHHHHHHHNQHNDNETDTEGHFSQTSLSDFISLIGSELHWLVRTRDALGLTPLHKAVLFNNRPIVEYILDRYPEELAPATWRHCKSTAPAAYQPASGPTASRLIDAQDKYGRTALHYAAAHLGHAVPKEATGQDTRSFHTISHLYHFLVSKGASMRLADFKGKTAPHYVRHPNELRVKSIIHLSNKLNANYQANVLSKTLRASSSNHLVGSNGLDKGEMISLAEMSCVPDQAEMNPRDSMSVSCNDLSGSGLADQRTTKFPRSHSNMQEKNNNNQKAVDDGEPILDELDSLERTNLEARRMQPMNTKPLTRPTLKPSEQLDSNTQLSLTRLESPASSDSTISFEHLSGQDEDLAMKQLQHERLKSHQILTQQDRVRIKRCLNEGIVERINELLVEGLGSYMMEQANVSCWNQQCRRYINKVIPDKLSKLDQLHELIVRNQLLAVKSLLQQEPILARVLRPYRRASMSALHLAVHFGRKVLVKYLTGSFPELVQQRDSQGATCLHWAARSLKNDRLYCWLLDRYGPQLEQARDLRGKSAADFRQQALRLSTFSETHPAPKQAHCSASELMEQNQDLSNRLLSLSGSRAKLNEHSTNNKRKTQPPRSCDSPPTLSSSGLLIDNSASINTCGEANTLTNNEQQEQVKPRNVRIHRLVSSASTGSQPTNSEPLHHHRHHERRLSESIAMKQPHPLAARKAAAAAAAADPMTPSCGSSGRQSCSDNVFLNEFAELDVQDETSTTSTAATSLRDSPLATPTLETPLARPNSASSRQKLDVIMLDSIRAEDYKKLEHLILAGCGERLLRLFHKSLANSDSEVVSAKMQEFLASKVPDYMQKIAKIYEVLHRCYSCSLTRRTTEQQNSADNNDETANSVFHKLCNLLDRRRLIMARDPHGACLLHVALLRSDRRLVEYLLRRHPEAASAPDHESRTALHYAAIVLAAHNKHGTFKLTCSSSGSNGNNENKDDGFWLVDNEAKLTYNRLCSRYGGELMEAKDKRGLSCGQYLSETDEGQQRTHTQMTAAEYSDSSCSLVEPMKVFGECCPDYAKLLSRYNYSLLLFDCNKHEERTEVVAEQQQQQQQPNETTAEETSQRSLDKNENDEAEKQSKVAQITAAPVAMRRNGNGQRRSTRSSPIASDLVLNGQLIMSSSAAGQLAAPPPPQSPTVLQVAPKPIVGSDHGYPTHSSPTVLNGNNNHGSAHHHHQHHHHHHTSLLGNHRRRLDANDLEPSASCSQSPNGNNRNNNNNNHRRHHHHHHHHNRHHHLSAAARRAHRAEDELVSKSLVGGVIVPTIIHNDKMDEIETYDIIYRQPPPSASPSLQVAISQESIAGLSSSSSSSMISVSSPSSLSPEKLASEPPPGCVPNPTESKLNGSDCGSNSGSSSSSSSTSDEDDDDERVERLSDEFESRVRREKSELKAKVDQIMSEIKMSAKSGKSSRFLASPCPNNNLDNNQKEDNNDQVPSTSTKSGTQNQRVMLAMDSRAVQQRNQSLSSSGPHSCSSSGSLTVSRTTSAASSTSCSSTTTTNSSSNSYSGNSSASSSRSSTTSSTTAATQIQQQQQKQQAHDDEQDKKRHQQQQEVNTNNNKQQTEAAAAIAANGSQLSSKNTYGQTYLHFIASRSQNASTFYKVLKHGSYLIGERDVFYRTARDVAIQFNLSQNVQILDKFIIDLFVEGKTQPLRHLLNQGYSPLIHVSDPDGNDIMLILKLLKLDRMIHFLLQMADFQRWRDELHTFIRNGYSGGVSELLRKHKDIVRAKSVHARTSLHLAVLFDRVGMVEELIEADPLSVHVTDNMGRTALHYTYGLQSMANIELIRDKLLAAGATLDARDVKMRTPKYYYIFKREIEEIKRIELELN